MNIQTVYNGMAKRASIHKQAFDWNRLGEYASKYAPEGIGALAGGALMSLAGGRKGRLLRFILGAITGGFAGRPMWNAVSGAYNTYRDNKAAKDRYQRIANTPGLSTPGDWERNNRKRKYLEQNPALQKDFGKPQYVEGPNNGSGGALGSDWERNYKKNQ